RSPLWPEPKPRPPFDLHVLGMPPAFVLSQDQTLKFIHSPTRHQSRRPAEKLLGARLSQAYLKRHASRQTRLVRQAAARASLPLYSVVQQRQKRHGFDPRQCPASAERTSYLALGAPDCKEIL